MKQLAAPRDDVKRRFVRRIWSKSAFFHSAKQIQPDWRASQPTSTGASQPHSHFLTTQWPHTEALQLYTQLPAVPDNSSIFCFYSHWLTIKSGSGSCSASYSALNPCCIMSQLLLKVEKLPCSHFGFSNRYFSKNVFLLLFWWSNRVYLSKNNFDCISGHYSTGYLSMHLTVGPNVFKARWAVIFHFLNDMSLLSPDNYSQHWW